MSTISKFATDGVTHTFRLVLSPEDVEPITQVLGSRWCFVPELVPDPDQDGRKLLFWRRVQPGQFQTAYLAKTVAGPAKERAVLLREPHFPAGAGPQQFADFGPRPLELLTKDGDAASANYGRLGVAFRLPALSPNPTQGQLPLVGPKPKVRPGQPGQAASLVLTFGDGSKARGQLSLAQAAKLVADYHLQVR